MKLFKKVLAAALAGVLALSVLTGCNNSAATVTMVDALNDWAKIYGVDTTFEKGDEKLQVPPLMEPALQILKPAS